MTNPLTDLEAYTDAELKEATSVIPFSPAATLLSRKSDSNRNINQWNKEQ
jgi:hypothetical protein